MVIVQCSISLPRAAPRPCAVEMRRIKMATKKTVLKGKRMQALAPFVARAREAQAKLNGRRAELIAFNNDNLAAVKAAGQAFVAGAKPLAELAAGNARNQVQAFRDTAASLKGVKSPIEAF